MISDPPTPPATSFLILGAGWTSTFLLSHLTALSIPYAATTRDGRDGTIPFTFTPSSAPDPDLSPYERLPSAKAILITFPLKGSQQPPQLIGSYRKIHGAANSWILLGSTGIWKGPGWHSSASPYDTGNERAQAEDEMLRMLGQNGCVLDLAGLWGGERHPKSWISRVARDKEGVKGKGALHLVHGRDVARAVVGCYEQLGCGGGAGGADVAAETYDRGKDAAVNKVGGKRWLVTDLGVYDWWAVVMAFGSGEERSWVREAMREEGVRALPRDGEVLGRRLDGRRFWEVLGRGPERGLMGG